MGADAHACGRQRAQTLAGRSWYFIPMSDTNAVWEFFSPFAHIPGKYEWCRIHSPTHGTFDCFIVLGASTAVPPSVYVSADNGERFMRERYPESATYRVGQRRLRIRSSSDGCDVRGFLRSETGPVRRAAMRFSAEPAQLPAAIPYGGQDFPVWGGRWACEGVDLVREGRCDGSIRFADGTAVVLRKESCAVTAGSFARIAPLARRPR